MTKKELNKLKKNLPKNFRDTIAEECDCSLVLVDKVLLGTRKNIKVLKVATDLALAHKEEIDALSKQIKSL